MELSPATAGAGFALAGALEGHAALRVRVLKLEAPLDDIRVRSACKSLEVALTASVKEFRSSAFCLGNASSSSAAAAAAAAASTEEPPAACHTLVLPATSDTLVVVSTHTYAQVVGLFLSNKEGLGDAEEGERRFTVHEPQSAEDGEEVLRSVGLYTLHDSP
jgi:hypothetical protein